MSMKFSLVDVPETSAGRTAAPNPFEPAAEAAVQAQEKGKAIAFPLDVTSFEDDEKGTAVEKATAYTVRKVRELGAKYDRTFTVVVEAGVVTVAAKPRIVRKRKSADA